MPSTDQTSAFPSLACCLDALVDRDMYHMENILIIKANASGDVLRTTVLLHVLRGNVFWITAAYNIPLFPDKYQNLTLIPVESIPAEILQLEYDLVINLEEDKDLALLITGIRTRQLIGVYWNNGMLDYSADSAEWFDMSLISKLPASHADKLKRQNTFSYQEIIYRMIGQQFSGQQYILYESGFSNGIERKNIGIEERVGSRWPNKYWHGYKQLNEILRKGGFDVCVFEHREDLRQYMEDIYRCKLIIAGDTLAMHIALGYSIPCIAIFNCTSPAEIFDYGVLKKMISPALHEVFYNTLPIKKAIEAVSVDAVLGAIYPLLHLQVRDPKSTTAK